MSTYLTRKPATDFGMPKLDDFGMDAMPERFEPDPGDDFMQRQIMALLDMGELAHKADKTLSPTERNEVLSEAAEALVEALREVGVIETTKTVLLVDLDFAEPAKARHIVTEGAYSPLTRQPDFFDADMAWWIGERGVVGYAAEHFGMAATLTQDHGFKVRQGVLPTEAGLVVMPHGATWDVGMGTRNLAYTLWTIAADTVEAKA